MPVKYGHFCCSLKKKKFTKFNHSNFQVFTLLKVFAEPVEAPQPTLCSVITHLSGWYGDVVIGDGETTLEDIYLERSPL